MLRRLSDSSIHVPGRHLFLPQQILPCSVHSAFPATPCLPLFSLLVLVALPFASSAMALFILIVMNTFILTDLKEFLFVQSDLLVLPIY